MATRWATPDEALAFLDGRPYAGATRWARGVVLGAEPRMRERIAHGWGALTLHHPAAGYVAGLFPHRDGARVVWEHGVELFDPEGLLAGTGRQVRWLPVDAPDGALAQAIEAFLGQAVALRS